MPNKKSAEKALRQSKKRRARNFKVRGSVKGVVKEIRTLAAQDKASEAQQLLPKAYKTLDKAAKQGVLKKNTAARKKSRLTKLLVPHK